MGNKPEVIVGERGQPYPPKTMASGTPFSKNTRRVPDTGSGKHFHRLGGGELMTEAHVVWRGAADR